MSNITLTESQQRVFKSLCDFIDSKTDRVFILRGYAGTGKTTMMKFLVERLAARKRICRLLAPTGRAAKILREKAFDGKFPKEKDVVSTIHSMLYQFKDFNQDVESIRTEQDARGQLYLIFEPTKLETTSDYNGCVYIIDESSMITDKATEHVIQAKFGSGRTLTELLNYDTHPNSKFVFVGDPCQLPPVNDTQSLALVAATFEKRRMPCREAQLTEIIRQADTNSIVRTSATIRKMRDSAPEDLSYYGNNKFWGKLPFKNSGNIIIHPNKEDLISDYIGRVKNRNYEKATLICRANKTCEQTSVAIRESLGFDHRKLLEKGDLLLVIQNNLVSGLVNGDMVEVELVLENQRKELAGLSFVQVQVKEIVSGKSFTQYLLENTISQNILNLSAEQQTHLFVNFIVRMKKKGIMPKSKEFNMMLQIDPFLNALRCVYGYALTCHKSQGGEWDDVYVDMPRNIMLNPIKETYQWVYTAMTRARQRLHVVDDFYLK